MMVTDGSWWALVNPFAYLGVSAAGKIAADAWTAAMLGLWNAGLWLLRLVLSICDAFLTPDLRETGPAGGLYASTFWLAGALVLILAMAQLGLAAFRRDGRTLAAALVGTGQFALVWSTWLAAAVLVVTACGGLTRALLQSLLGVNTWAAWDPWAAFTVGDITDGTVATVLGLLGTLLWLAALGHLLVMLTRAGALIVLAALTPIAAAGLVSDTGRGWFWKSLRWFLAASFTPVLMALVLGVGVQVTTGVATGAADSLQSAVGTAVPGVLLILISSFSPLALFKLLAFVDPGTSSGAALRHGLAAYTPGGAGQTGGSGAGSSPDGTGRSAGEADAADTTSSRFAQAGQLFGTAGAAAGQALGAGLSTIAGVGSRAAAVGADLTNQMGVGHDTYHPDLTPTPSRPGGSGAEGSSDAGGSPGGGGGAGMPPGGPGGGGNDGPADLDPWNGDDHGPVPSPPGPLPAVPTSPPGVDGGRSPAGGGGSSAGGRASTGGRAAAGQAGGAEAAAVVI